MKVAKMRMLNWLLSVTSLERIKNEYLRGSFGETNIAENMKESGLSWFHMLKEEIYIQKICKIRVEGNLETRSPKVVVREDMRVCRIDEDMVSDKKMWKDKMRVAYPTWVGWR